MPAEAELFLVGHGFGTQNYVCVPSGAGFAFTLFTPQTTLFDDDSEQIITHFFSPNPDEKAIIRVTSGKRRSTRRPALSPAQYRNVLVQSGRAPTRASSGAKNSPVPPRSTVRTPAPGAVPKRPANV